MVRLSLHLSKCHIVENHMSWLMSFRRQCDVMTSHRRQYDVVLACLLGIFIIFVINTIVIKIRKKLARK